jgi:uncharacterized protein (DUF1778 family)
MLKTTDQTTNKTVRIEIRISPEDEFRLDGCCRYLRISRAEFVRRMITSGYRDVVTAQAMIMQDEQQARA